jgi:glycolate oxidase iron-sulfur subunit
LSIALTSALASEEQKLLACIHCGLCLEACPTYVHTGDENDGPRGRLYLMRAVGEGRLADTSPSFERHIDRCLGCRACEAVCPAGVEYGQLLETSRAELFESDLNRGFIYKLLRAVLRHVWLHPPRLRFAFFAARIIRDAGLARALLQLRIARFVSRRFEFALALLAASSPSGLTNEIAKTQNDWKGPSSENLDVKSAPQFEAMLFTGCVTEGLFSRVNRATARVLGANDFVTSSPGKQVCCGALHAHAGDLEGARMLARKNLGAFAHAAHAPIVTNAGGCGAMLSSYGHLLANDEQFAERAQKFSARVCDVSQLLQTATIKPGGRATEKTVTYDASCHLLYGQRAGDAPLRMLEAIPNLKFVPLEGAERCCGGAGVYNLLEPAMSQSVLNEKLSRIRETGAEVLATGNPGCHMQIGAGALLSGMHLKVCHPVELLDQSYQRAGLYAESGNQHQEEESQLHSLSYLRSGTNSGRRCRISDTPRA